MLRHVCLCEPRAPDYESGGQRFESFRARHFSAGFPNIAGQFGVTLRIAVGPACYAQAATRIVARRSQPSLSHRADIQRSSGLLGIRERLSLTPMAPAVAGIFPMASIKIRVAHDGSFAVYHNGNAVCSGLTRPQAERLAAVLGWVAPAR